MARAGPTRLLVVSSHGADTTVGGAEMHLHRLARALPNLGYEVGVVSAFPTANGGEVAVLHRRDWREDRGQRVRNHLGDLVARPSRRLEEVAVGFGPDLVHTHNLHGISTGIWETSRRLGVPVVHSLHDYYLLCPRVTLSGRGGEPCGRHRLCGLRAGRLARWSGAVSDVIGVSRFVLDRHEHLFPGARSHLVRNPAGASDPDLPPPGPRLNTLGYIGSLSDIKGVRELLRAVPDLAQVGCQVRIAGDGRRREAVAEAARQHPSLRYDGHVSGNQKRAFLASCDAGIVPSVWPEPGGPPHVAIEWLAAGRPLLVSTRGGLGESVAHRPGAIAIEPSAGGIVEAVRRLNEPEGWRAARAAALAGRGSDREDRSDADWIVAHDEIYRRALSH